MTASINPDDHSYAAKDADYREAEGFVYDDPNTPPTELESAYVPEREFVLMPLFRRIGELLGIHRREEPEHIYEAPKEAASIERKINHEALNSGFEVAAHSEPALASTAEPAHEPVQEWAQLEPSGFPESVPTVPERSLQARSIHDVPEIPATQEPAESELLSAPVEQSSFEPTSLQASHEEPLQALSTSFDDLEPPQPGEEPTHEAAVELQAPQAAAHEPELLVARSAKQAQPQRRQPAPRRKDEIDEAIAVLREAGSKVSTAISQAVEWLSVKEQELVRKAERSFAPAPKARRVQTSAATRNVIKPQSQVAPSPAGPVAPPRTPETNPAPVPQWETGQFPALQREVSWTGQVVPASVERRFTNVQPAARAASSARRGPTLVKARPRVPFWKRIDWAAEFTPKRVAVLGGVIMAMLIVAGVTFARRPASEVLPPQPHTIQPGGVTITTHPSSPTAAAPLQHSHKTAPSAKGTVAPPPRRATRAVAPEEPDVVTHVYKQKPSPSKQSTVAGVKHYSDIE